jgi:hypothetical protein
MYLSISSKKSRPQETYQRDNLISDNEQQVDDFVGELTF